MGFVQKAVACLKKEAMRNLVSQWHQQAWQGRRVSALLPIRRCVLRPACAIAALCELGNNLGLLLCPGKVPSQKLSLISLLLSSVGK